MGVVTISATYGAAGADVAHAVAERLGLTFHDRAIPAQVASRLGVTREDAEANDETVFRGLWRLVTSLATMPDPAGGVVPLGDELERAQLPPADRARAAGDRRGRRRRRAGPGRRAGAARPARRAARAPRRSARGGRLAGAVRRTGRPEEEVRRDMLANDRSRESYVRHFYRTDPARAEHYHLVVDSTALPQDAVIDLVVLAAHARGIDPR